MMALGSIDEGGEKDSEEEGEEEPASVTAIATQRD